MQSQILRRKCDAPGCAVVEDFDIQNMTADLADKVANWLTIVREVVDNNSQLLPIYKHVCSDACAFLVIKHSKSLMKGKVMPENLDREN